MKQIKVYLSHPIRGKMGNAATEEYIKSNNEKAVVMGNAIRLIFIRFVDDFPEIDLHVPAKHEVFVHRAYKMGYLTEDQILDVDCDIIDGVDLLLVFNHENHISRGMKIEMDYAEKHNIPIIEFSGITLGLIDKIVKMFNLKE